MIETSNKTLMNALEYAQSMTSVSEQFEKMYASVERLDKAKADEMYSAYYELMNRLAAGLCCVVTASRI